MSAGVLDQVWEGASDSWRWLRGVVLGEWEDDRSLSQLVADALAGFVPGLGSIITLRDLLAVIVRLAKHPEKREEVDEWILLIAFLLPLIITLLGVAAAGVGALVGAELGGFLRAVALFVVKKGGVALKTVVEFFRAHGYGDVIAALKQVKFAAYKDALLKGLNQQLDRLVKLVRDFEARLRSLGPESLPAWLPGRQAAIDGIAHCKSFVLQIESLRKKAIDMIPKALIEMDQRLGALLAGDIKGATQVTHTVATGVEAPAVAKLEAKPGESTAINPQPPEPGNTRRVAERRAVVLAAEKREYQIVDTARRPVGAKSYQHGVTKLEHPPLPEAAWREQRANVGDGWPDLGKEHKPGEFATNYDTFAHHINAASVPAGSKSTFVRIVSHDNATQHQGSFYNRALPSNGAEMRADSAIKESWNKNGEYVELRVPPKGRPAWQELHAIEEKTAGRDLPYKEELKFWEGPAASQVYEKKLADGKKMPDEWYLAGGKPQQYFDRDQIAVLSKYGFVSERKPTNFPDFDPVAKNIVPRGGPYLELIPPQEAVPHPSSKK